MALWATTWDEKLEGAAPSQLRLGTLAARNIPSRDRKGADFRIVLKRLQGSGTSIKYERR